MSDVGDPVTLLLLKEALSHMDMTWAPVEALTDSIVHLRRRRHGSPLGELAVQYGSQELHAHSSLGSLTFKFKIQLLSCTGHMQVFHSSCS